MKHRFLRALRMPKFFLPALGLALLLIVTPLVSIFAEDSVPTADLSASYQVDLYEPATDVNAAPIIMQSATADIYDVSEEAKRPSAIIFDLKLEDNVLTAYAGQTKLGAFADLYRANQPKANVGVRIALGDTATAQKLAVWAQAEYVGNLWLISNDVEVLKTVTSVATTVRGIVDLSGDTVRGPANVTHNFDKNNDGTVSNSEYQYYEGELVYEYKTFTGGYSALTWNEIYDLVFTFGNRTVLIPESAATKENIHTLQSSLVFTLVQTNKPSATEMYDLLVTGADGILTDDYATGISVLESDAFNANGGNILLRDSNVVGHRGDMGNLNVYPENTVEAIVSAAQSGASSVEFDIYGSNDWELLLVHSSSMSKIGYSYPENFAEQGILTQEQIDKNNALTKTYNRKWFGDLEYLVSNVNADVHISRLQDVFEAVDTEYPHLRLFIESKANSLASMNRIIKLMDDYGMRSRCIMVDNYNTTSYELAVYTSKMGVATDYFNSAVTSSTENRVYAFESAYRPVNTVWTTAPTHMNASFLEELKHFGVTVNPSYCNESQKELYANCYATGFQGGLTNNPHHTDDIISTLIPTFNAATGELSVTARTLAYGKTAAANAPVSVDKWWVEQGISSGKTEYSLTGFEIIILEGAENVKIEGNRILTKDGVSSAEATVAVRYQQTLYGGATCYVYSPSITVETDTGAPTSQTFRFSDASEITSIDQVTSSNYKTLSYTYSSADKALHPHLASGNNNWWYLLGTSSSLTNHWKPAWDYLRSTNRTTNAAYVAIVIDVAASGSYEMVLDLCNAPGYFGRGRMLLVPYSDANAGKFSVNKGVWLPEGIEKQALLDVTYDCTPDNTSVNNLNTRQALLGRYQFSKGKYIVIFLNNGAGAYSTTTNTGSSVYALTLTKNEPNGATLKQALNNAAANTVVQVCRDMDIAGDLSIPANVTLDLQGKVVTANTVSGQVVDSTGGTGGIKTAAGAPVLNMNGNYLPLYDATNEMYRSVKPTVTMNEEPGEGVISAEHKSYIFQIDLPEAAYKYVEASNMKVILDITHGDRTIRCDYTSSESLGNVNDWAAAKGTKAFFVDIANIDALSGKTVTFTTTIECGSVIITNSVNYDVP